MGDKLKAYFEDFLRKDPIFSNKKVLQTNYNPEKISYRDRPDGLLAIAKKFTHKIEDIEKELKKTKNPLIV